MAEAPLADPDRLRRAGENGEALHFLVGRDDRAGWIVTETHGRCGGLFSDEKAALRFAKEASGGRAEMIEFADRPLPPLFA
jgi:hypothetical protein